MFTGITVKNDAVRYRNNEMERVIPVTGGRRSKVVVAGSWAVLGRPIS